MREKDIKVIGMLLCEHWGNLYLQDQVSPETGADTMGGETIRYPRKSVYSQYTGCCEYKISLP